jgi:very-long-chain enoyl-CoA reductase
VQRILISVSLPTAPKQPIKKLPPTIDIPANATVEDVKKLIAKQAGISDYNQIGLFYTSTRKTLKDRKALIAEDKDVAEAGEVLVKDLGMAPYVCFSHIPFFFIPC